MTDLERTVARLEQENEFLRRERDGLRMSRDYWERSASRLSADVQRWRARYHGVMVGWPYRSS